MTRPTMAGDLRDRIVISRETRISDGMGGWTTEPVEIVTIWAHVKVPSSKDGVIAGADAEIRTHVVRVRQTATTMGVQINDLISWRGATLTVRSCRPLEREWVDYDCIEVVPE